MGATPLLRMGPHACLSYSRANMPLEPVRVTAAVIRDGDAVLLARRKAGTHLAGLWEFPGGKIEEGETARESLARELFEELAVRADVGDLVARNRHRYPHTEIELIAYEVRVSEAIESSTSHDSLRWVPQSDLLTYRLAPADIPIAKKLSRPERPYSCADRNRS